MVYALIEPAVFPCQRCPPCQIFEVHTRKTVLDREGVDFGKLAAVSEGLTGAEIEVCRGDLGATSTWKRCTGNHEMKYAIGV